MQPTDQPTKRRRWPRFSRAPLWVTLAWHAAGIAQTTSTPAPTPSSAPAPAQLERPAPRQDDDPPIRLRFNYDSDLNADLSGGARRGAAYLGKAAAIADADLDRLVGLRGVTAHVSILDIHGTGLSASRVDNLATVSGIEAEPALRLNQAWVESSVGEKAHLRIGKFPASEDFAVSDTAGFFINSTFGWPESFATDLPQGGPSWPLSAPGAMLKAPLSPRLDVAVAIFAGNPAGTESSDPQRDDGNGFQPFSLSGPPLVIAEVTRTLGENGTVKLGGWIHFARFAVLGMDQSATVAHDWSLYGVVDGPISALGIRQLHGFARATVAPANRNAVGLYFDLGATLTAPFKARPNDTVGIALARIGLSDRLHAPGLPGAEYVIEASYSAALAKWLSVQPNVQLVVDPVDPSTFVGRKGTALVLGLRTNLSW